MGCIFAFNTTVVSGGSASATFSFPSFSSLSSSQTLTPASNSNSILLNCSDGTKIVAQNVINCAGLSAHTVARSILPSSANIPKIYFAKGNYFKTIGKNPAFARLIYPVPVPGGLGIHATMDLSGQVIDRSINSLNQTR
jgi:L-2-hydroxyglutarate oxidase LhgO